MFYVDLMIPTREGGTVFYGLLWAMLNQVFLA